MTSSVLSATKLGARGVGEELGRGDTDPQPGERTRPVGDRHEPDAVRLPARVTQRVVDDDGEHLGRAPALGELRLADDGQVLQERERSTAGGGVQGKYAHGLTPCELAGNAAVMCEVSLRSSRSPGRRAVGHTGQAAVIVTIVTNRVPFVHIFRFDATPTVRRFPSNGARSG